MELIYIWEKIIYAAAFVAIAGPIIVGILSFKWIGKTYFPKNNK